MAVIGIGRLGLAVVQRLVAAGHRVTACDVRAERAEMLPDDVRFAAGADGAVAGAEVLLTALPGSPELRGLLLGDGLLGRLPSGLVWIDLTSAAPDLGEELAAAAAHAGVRYLDAPVGGGPAEIAAGRATLYAGGDAAVLDAHRPLLASFAGRVEHVGGAGAGYLTKLLVNLLWFGQAVLAAEALGIARGAGLSETRLAEVLASSAVAGDFVRDYLPRLLDGDHVPVFGLDRCVEELDSLERCAGGLGAPAGFTALIARVHRAALDRFGPVDGELLGAAHVLHPPGSR